LGSRLPASSHVAARGRGRSLVADLRGDVEWAVEGCDAVVFAAGARHRAELGAVDGGGAAKLAEAADRFDAERFVLCSAVGADSPDLRRPPLRDFLVAKRQAERRLERLNMPWTILRFGGLTDGPATGRITTTVNGRPLMISRQDAAATVVATLDRRHLARRVVEVVEGERRVADALDAVEPGPLPPSRARGLAAAQSHNAPADPNMCSPTLPRWMSPSTTRAMATPRPT
jgi:nucleoside-diphosphate-sugar epimerase